MSADNYILIRRVGQRYAVSDESASAAAENSGSVAGLLSATTPVDGLGVELHDDLDSARNAALRRYSEYGLSEMIDTDSSDDTWAARLHTAGAALADRFAFGGWETCGDGTITLDYGAAKVVIAASDGGDAWDRAEWFEATHPAAVGDRPR